MLLLPALALLQLRWEAGQIQGWGFAGFNPAKGEKWEDASDVLWLSVRVYGYLIAVGCAGALSF